MGKSSVMHIWHHAKKQHPGSVWSVKKYCFGIGINLHNNCCCLVWQKTVRHDVSWVWLGQIGIGVKMICWAKTSYKTVTSTKNRSGDDASFFQENALPTWALFKFQNAPKTLGEWCFHFPRKPTDLSKTPFKFQNAPQLVNWIILPQFAIHIRYHAKDKIRWYLRKC